MYSYLNKINENTSGSISILLQMALWVCVCTCTDQDGENEKWASGWSFSCNQRLNYEANNLLTQLHDLNTHLNLEN